MVRMERNLIESLDARYYGGERGRNLRILHECRVFLALNADVMQLGVERLAHLAGRGVEVNHAGIVQHAANPKAMRFQPRCERGNILGRSAKTGAKFGRGQPPMIFGRTRLLLAGDQVLKVGFLRRSMPQHEEKLERLRVFYRAKVRRVCNVLADISFQGCQNLLVDRRHQMPRRCGPGLKFGLCQKRGDRQGCPGRVRPARMRPA